VFPGPIFERRFNARKIQESGAGKMGEIPDFTVEWLQAALAHPERHADIAKSLGKKLSTYGGAQASIQELTLWSSAKGNR
jgi:hypothetical protein